MSAVQPKPIPDHIWQFPDPPRFLSARVCYSGWLFAWT